MTDTQYGIGSDPLLTQLASILSKNLVTNSFPIGLAKEPLAVMLKEGVNKEEKRSRNILVVGAGATHSVNPQKLPLATGAIDVVKQAICEKYGEKIVHFIDKKIEELTRVYKLTGTDFETQLLACSMIDKEIVLQQLDKLYNHKYPVSLFYEIVAHLFKHRFIDVIINFNFDEILDNAIEEEMSDSQWTYIYSDGHCPDKEKMNDLLHNNRLAFPIYIKPHGTISHPSTLRFTRQAYFDTPSKIRDTIIYLIKGETGIKRNGQSRLPINLIVAGFGLKSHEFNDILTKYLEPHRASLYYFDMYNEDPNFCSRFKVDNIESFTTENTFIFPLLNEGFGNRSLDDWFYLLWNKIQVSFKETYEPKGIARHVIIYEMFSHVNDSIIDGQYLLANYFKDRAIVELALEIFSSSDGLINLRQLKESRVQKYFSLYKKEGNEGVELFHLLKDFELKEYKGYIKDTWYFDKGNEDYVELISRLLKKKVSSWLSQHLININDVERLNKYISRLAKSKKLFLNLRFSARDNYVSIFQKITPDHLINTDIKWIYTFQQYFSSETLRPKWNLILSISETGGIFCTPGVVEYLNDKKLMLICAYNGINSGDIKMSPKKKKREELLNGKLNRIKQHLVLDGEYPELRMLPFRNHNQHVVLFTNVNTSTKEIKLVGGIYYTRRNLSKRVTPIHIEDKDQDDLKALYSVFVNYWERACKDDQIDLIKEAVVNNKITPEIRELAARSGSKSLDALSAEIVAAFSKDRES
jgi:hypothetical protein